MSSTRTPRLRPAGALANFSDTSASSEQYSKPIVVNTIFAENHAGLNGGAITNNTASPTVTNCTIYGNTADNGGGGIANIDSQATIANCILWGNTATPQMIDNNSLTTMIYCDTEDGASGTNISADPVFADAAARDFHLLGASACIDAGLNTSGAPFGAVTVDFEGDLRGYQGFLGSRGDGSFYDIGVDEYTGPPVSGEGEG